MAFTVVTQDSGGASTTSAPERPSKKTVTVFAVDRTDHACPANTNENVLWSTVIPGGTLGPNGALRITTLWAMNTTANNKNMRVKFGTKEWQNVAYASLATCQNQVYIYNRNSVSAQLGQNVAAANPFGGSGSAQVSGTDNTDTDLTLSITGQLSNSGDTLVLKSVTVEVLK